MSPILLASIHLVLHLHSFSSHRTLGDTPCNDALPDRNPEEVPTIVEANVELKDHVVVDLDENQIRGGSDVRLPKEAGDYLLDAMNRELDALKGELEGLEKSKKRSRDVWTAFTLRSKAVFSNFFIILLNNYVDFIYIPPEVDIDNVTCGDVLDREGYLQIFPPSSVSFMREFTQTMMFCKFVEDSFRAIYLSDVAKSVRLEDQHDEISTFISAIRTLKSERSHAQKSPSRLLTSEFGSFEARQNQLVDSVISVLEKPRRINVGPFVTQYTRILAEREKTTQRISQSVFIPRRQFGSVSYKKKVTLDVRGTKDDSFIRKLLKPLAIFSQPFRKKEEEEGEVEEDIYTMDIMSRLTITTPDDVAELNTQLSLFDWIDETKIVSFPQLQVETSPTIPERRPSFISRHGRSSVSQVTSSQGVPISTDNYFIYYQLIKRNSNVYYDHKTSLCDFISHIANISLESPLLFSDPSLKKGSSAERRPLSHMQEQEETKRDEDQYGGKFPNQL